jgi:HEAT repeat protein
MGGSLFLLTLAGAAALAAPAQSPAGSARPATEMEPLLARIAQCDWAACRPEQAQFTQLVQDCLASPEIVRQIEARLLRFLQSDATVSGKDFAFRELGLIASDASVPWLASLLTRDDIAETARLTLARIPGPAASEALRNAFDKTSGRIRIGIINSLGQRRDPDAVTLLAALISPADPAVAEAAGGALSKIADRPALDALSAARARTSGVLRQRLSEAYFECAGHFVARGENEPAVKVYRELTAPVEPPTLRLRALAGLAAAEGPRAAPVLLAAVESRDSREQASAIRLLGGIPGADITGRLMECYSRLAPAGQVRLLTALAERGDASSVPLLLKAVRSASAPVQAAALGGLGKLGDQSSLMVLAEAAAAGTGVQQAAARAGLVSLRGPAVDAALIEGIGSSAGKVRYELIIAAGGRGTAGAADAIAKMLPDKDPDAQREALRALRNIAGLPQVPALLDALMKAPAPSEGREAAQTLAVVVKRVQPSQIGAVLTAYQSTSSLQPRLGLLEVMGHSSRAEALPVLRASIHDSNVEVVRAGILALSEWNDPAPLADLFAIAKTGPTPTLRILALRGYLRVIAARSHRSNAESARMLAEAMPLATDVAEKRMVLALLPSFPCPESLEVARSAMNDQAVKEEANAAANRVEQLWRRAAR